MKPTMPKLQQTFASKKPEKMEFEFISKYPEEMAKYEAVTNTISNVPFFVDTGIDNVWYYLSAITNREKVVEITKEQWNCRHCGIRMAKCAGYFGPDGYAVDFGGVETAGPLYSQIEQERPSLIDLTNLRIDNQRTFIISQDNMNKYPRTLGANKESGESFVHIGLNIPPTTDYITNPVLVSKISNKLLCNLWNGSMNGLLEEIVTMLQKKDEVTGQTDFDVIVSAAKRDETLRKDFWDYRINTVHKIQTFARKFKNGCNWELLSEVDKMHVRVFALLYGGSYSEDTNPTFKATRQIVDISKDAEGISSISRFMNERSDPNFYMVQQVARKNTEKNVNAPFIVSLSWNSRSDLDGHILIENEHVYWSKKTSASGETYLNFDANGGGTPTKEPVETFTLSSKRPGCYKFKVNNFSTRDSDDTIPFTVVTKLAGEIQTYQDVWDCRTRGKNSDDDLSQMIDICTIEITQDMIDALNIDIELSRKQATRLKQLLPEFRTKFGSVTTQIANMAELHGYLLLSDKSTHGKNREVNEANGAEAKLTELLNLANREGEKSKETKINSSTRRGTLGSRSSNSVMNTIVDILAAVRSHPASISSIAIRGRNYYPSTITSHSCKEMLKTNVIVNSYIEEGKPPVQPNTNLRETCRFEKEWSQKFSGKIHGTAIVPIKNMFYDGFFLSLDDVYLPKASETSWCVGAGMYPTDLTADNFKYREVWATLHSSVRPTVGLTNTIPAIGVFLHRGQSYEIIVNGEEMMISV
mmetsp:Transcript_42263/g.47209  ORF Transcript_42263/g.47209 Transcript_42263/m.47209 type:complete len:756 (+) Transcript_42263:53-2320(+)